MVVLAEEKMKRWVYGGRRATYGEETTSVYGQTSPNGAAVRVIFPRNKFTGGRVPTKKITAEEGTAFRAEEEVVRR
jgi:hypothetical protein